MGKERVGKDGSRVLKVGKSRYSRWWAEMGETRTRTKRITIEVEVPEELAEAVERSPWLERILALEGVEGLRRRLELLARLDLLTPETSITEEELMEMDREIKRRLARRLEDELLSSSSRH